MNNFQVNLQGIIDLLSNHLYSDAGVFIRELLQNGVDAITARKRLGHQFAEQVTVEVFASGTLAFTDNGIGLTQSEIEQFLARIGGSTKRDELDGADDFIGQFGVGLLSCFVVCEEIVLITRSALEGDSLEWKGKPDGTYTIRKLKREVPIGTTVYLKAKPDYEEYAAFYRVHDLLRHYGEFLPFPIYLAEDNYKERINESKPPWLMPEADVLKFGEELSHRKPMDAITLRSQLGGIEGVAYILPYAVNLQEEKKHKVYLKGMLLSDKIHNILPPWAFFVHAIMNTDSLKPTASREAFQENDLFYVVQGELGECIKQYFIRLSERDPELLKRIVSVHFNSIKTMAVEDHELYRLFIGHLTFETSFGSMTMQQIMNRTPHIRLTATLDEFRQITRVAKAQELLVINGGYVHDFELVRKADEVWEEAEVEVLDILAFANQFQKLDHEDRALTAPFLKLADEVLSAYQCQCQIRKFAPADVAVLYNTSSELHFLKMAEDAVEKADDLFTDIVDLIRHELFEEPLAQLCFNYNNPMVRKAAACEDPELARKTIELLYTQALLMGNHPLGPEELKLMNTSLLHFMNLGLDRELGGRG